MPPLWMCVFTPKPAKRGCTRCAGLQLLQPHVQPPSRTAAQQGTSKRHVNGSESVIDCGGRCGRAGGRSRHCRQDRRAILHARQRHDPAVIQAGCERQDISRRRRAERHTTESDVEAAIAAMPVCALRPKPRSVLSRRFISLDWGR